MEHKQTPILMGPILFSRNLANITIPIYDFLITNIRKGRNIKLFIKNAKFQE